MAKPGSGDKDVAFDTTTPDEPGAAPGGSGPRDETPIGTQARRDAGSGVHSDRVAGAEDRTALPDDLLQSTELPDAPRRPR